LCNKLHGRFSERERNNVHGIILFEDASQRARSCLLDRRLDGIVRSGGTKAAGQINHGHIRSGDPEGHFHKFSSQRGNDFSNGFGCTGGGGYDIAGGCTAAIHSSKTYINAGMELSVFLV